MTPHFRLKSASLQNISTPETEDARSVATYRRGVDPWLASQTAVELSKSAREHQRHRQTARAGDQDVTPTTELEVPDPP